MLPKLPDAADGKLAKKARREEVEVTSDTQAWHYDDPRGVKAAKILAKAYTSNDLVTSARQTYRASRYYFALKSI